MANFSRFDFSRFPEFNVNNVDEWESAARTYFREREPKLRSIIQNPCYERSQSEEDHLRVQTLLFDCVPIWLHPHLEVLVTAYQMWVFLTRTFPILTPIQRDMYWCHFLSASLPHQAPILASLDLKMTAIESLIQKSARRQKGIIKFLKIQGIRSGASSTAMSTLDTSDSSDESG